MPRAGSLVAANFLYSVAPRDGSVIGVVARDMPLLGLLGSNSNVQFDPRRFGWLGSSSSFADDAYVMIVRTDARVQSIEALHRPGGPPPSARRHRRRHHRRRRAENPGGCARAQHQAGGRLSRYRRHLPGHGARRSKRAHDRSLPSSRCGPIGSAATAAIGCFSSSDGSSAIRIFRTCRPRGSSRPPKAPAR
jgi:hypothetical protein